MDNINAFVIWLLLFVLLVKKRNSDRWLRRRWRRHPVNYGREMYGHYSTLFQEYKHYPDKFYQYLRMNYETFNVLLSLLEDKLQKDHPTALCPELRLVVTLRYLISGDQLHSIADNFRIGYTTTIQVVVEVCEILVTVLQPLYLRMPVEEEWRYIAADFLLKWNLPNCVGAIDGKHVTIIAPDNSGTLYYNYKKRFSIVLFAACDANYLFTAVHIGEMGSNSDAAIFADSDFGYQLREDLLDLPKGTARLPGSNIRAPCYFVADDAFPLRTNLMKPYVGPNLTHAQKIFGYRVSRARRIIESTFGMLRTRFRILQGEITIQPTNATAVVTACVCLHNFINIESNNNEEKDVPSFMQRFENERGIEMRGPIAMRDTLAGYFLTEEGQVPWQEAAIDCMHNLRD